MADRTTEKLQIGEKEVEIYSWVTFREALQLQKASTESGDTGMIEELMRLLVIKYGELEGEPAVNAILDLPIKEVFPLRDRVIEIFTEATANEEKKTA